MKAMRLREVRELLRSSAFLTWLERYEVLRADIRTAEAHHQELLRLAHIAAFEVEQAQQLADDTVLKAGECDDFATSALAEAARIENDSFELLSSFESQRQVTTDLWGELNRAEMDLEELRAEASEIRTRLEAARKSTRTAGGLSEETRMGEEVKALDGQVDAQVRHVDLARARVDAEVKKRDGMWSEVEATWSAAFRANMARNEYGFQARRVRRQAEDLLGRASEERRRVEKTRAEIGTMESRMQEARNAYQAHLTTGRETFGCVLIEEFLYWPHEEDVHLAFCVPLIDESEHLNLQVHKAQVYVVERARGVTFVEPVPPEELGMEDPRLDRFFAASAAVGP